MRRINSGCCGLAITIILGITAPALAHALEVPWVRRGDKIEITAQYDDGKPAIRAKAQLVDSDDRVISQGETDAEGRWSFDVPAPGRYWIIVDDGAGHRTKIPFGEEPPPVVDSAFPWLKIGIGLAAIVGFCAVLWFVRQYRRPPAARG